MTRIAVLLLALLLLAPFGPGCARPRQIEGFHMRVYRSQQAGRPSDLPTVYAEVSASRAARERGLGGRTELARDAGMLFVYPEPRPREFWMKDCRIGLDIAFLDAQGRILSIATLPPGEGLPYDDIPRAKSGGDALYVLETAAGWFAAEDIRIGDRVDVSRAVEGVLAE